MNRKPLIAASILLAGSTLCALGNASIIMEWNANLVTALRAGTPVPVPAIWQSAIVHAAIFDAVNGIEREYTPYHVAERGPRHANPHAAAAWLEMKTSDSDSAQVGRNHSALSPDLRCHG